MERLNLIQTNDHDDLQIPLLLQKNLIFVLENKVFFNRKNL